MLNNPILGLTPRLASCRYALLPREESPLEGRQVAGAGDPLPRLQEGGPSGEVSVGSVTPLPLWGFFYK